jgi:hypothetical protein
MGSRVALGLRKRLIATVNNASPFPKKIVFQGTLRLEKLSFWGFVPRGARHEAPTPKPVCDLLIIDLSIFCWSSHG